MVHSRTPPERNSELNFSKKHQEMTPFELLFGTKMKSCQDIEIDQLLNNDITDQFQEQRDALRQDAKKQIYKVKDEKKSPHVISPVQTSS
ncbi:hypothetical protein TNCV_847601 [Trichonephila clavipes]|nr:hypothetical protein TNCV_847601 [Trichonephila clavipes]